METIWKQMEEYENPDIHILPFVSIYTTIRIVVYPEDYDCNVLFFLALAPLGLGFLPFRNLYIHLIISKRQYLRIGVKNMFGKGILTKKQSADNLSILIEKEINTRLG